MYKQQHIAVLLWNITILYLYEFSSKRGSFPFWEVEISFFEVENPFLPQPTVNFVTRFEYDTQ
jgi:hypothetical protein